MICTGEGELPMLEIVGYMEGKIKIDSIKGIAFNNKAGDLTANPPVTPMSIPLVIDEAWTLLDPDLYKFNDKRKYGVAINTMRGCWNKCTFCSEPYRWPAVKCMNHEDIIRQLKIVKERLDPSYVFIGDSNFGYPIPRLKKFIKSMREEGLFIPFNCLARLDDIYRYRELLPELMEIGCFLIHYGGERTTDTGQSYLRKGESSSITEEVTKIIQDADIAAKATFIFGLPIDDRDSMKLMIDDIYRINPDIVSFGCYTPIPGTPSFKKDHELLRCRVVIFLEIFHS
ncbi:MAG: B12-binding domain-containing radical SAM protein [Candidatus Kariarchaeaceae archaeon]